MTVLDLPDPDTSRLSKAPLALVVFQVKHEPRAAVSETSVGLAVHAAMGGASGRYSKLEPHHTVGVSFAVGPDGNAQGQQVQATGWRMSSQDTRWIASIMPDSFSLETTAYTTWDSDFAERLNELLDAVAEVVSPELVQRIGLRYVNVLTASGATTAQDWETRLAPGVLGLAANPDLGGAVVEHRQQTVFGLDGNISALVMHGTVVQPGSDEVGYQLDYDIFREGSQPFDTAALKKDAADFNKRCLQIFQTTLSDEFLATLR